MSLLDFVLGIVVVLDEYDLESPLCTSGRIVLPVTCKLLGRREVFAKLRISREKVL